MTTARDHRTRPSRAFTVASLGAATLIGLLTTAALAADGPQPAPTINPFPVATASTNFELSNGSCDGTGGAGWRVQTFIVGSGVDIATLAFDQGVTSDQVGTDRDSTDGTLQAPLHDGNAAKTGFLPAASPPGLINPVDLGAFDFSGAGWVLTDGSYQIGYACLDQLSVLRQWWSVTVTLDADASSGAFLAAGTGGATTTTTVDGGGGTTTTSVGGGATTSTTSGGSGTTTTTTAGASTTTTTGGSTTTSAAGGSAATTTTTSGAGVLSAQSGQSARSGSLAATGRGFAVGGFGLLLIYLGRVVYLLSRTGPTAPDR